ncbi:MAG TPA: cation transporter [Planctomycetes bacterium]|nr:cation transporter [Planctomycetota bacterium]|tara:strand:+ start:124 stop:1197 length:1074 start_codon:yes stop_codon:yes gene_type:complete
MHTTQLDDWQHDHTFGQDKVSRGERRTLWVALLTAVFMVVEVAAGLAYGSMALLADGLHMGSHAVALGIAVAAYVYARRRAGDERFSFGTGKVNALGGYTGALLLALFAVMMAWESVDRFRNPVPIVFNQAIAVAVLGLLVNGISVAVLGVHHDHGHDHGQHGHHGREHHDYEHHDHEHHGHEHHGYEHHDHEHHDHEHRDHEHHDHAQDEHHDHNLRAAYFHVLADALTSLTAIFALLGGKYFGQAWLDPAMGIVGSLLVARWSWGLIRQSSKVLLDHQEPQHVRQRVRAALEVDDDRVVDLHVWSIGPGVRAATIAVVAHEPVTPAEYKARIPENLLHHVTVEVNRCPGVVAATP